MSFFPFGVDPNLIRKDSFHFCKVPRILKNLKVMSLDRVLDLVCSFQISLFQVSCVK